MARGHRPRRPAQALRRPALGPTALAGNEGLLAPRGATHQWGARTRAWRDAARVLQPARPADGTACRRAGGRNIAVFVRILSLWRRPRGREGRARVVSA